MKRYHLVRKGKGQADFYLFIKDEQLHIDRSNFTDEMMSLPIQDVYASIIQDCKLVETENGYCILPAQTDWNTTTHDMENSAPERFDLDAYDQYLDEMDMYLDCQGEVESSAYLDNLY